MQKRSLTKGLSLILVFSVVVSMLTGCGKPKTPQLLPMSEPPTVEAEPERKPNYVRGCAIVVMMFAYLIITKQPNPPIALQNIRAWLTAPQNLANLATVAVGISAYKYVAFRKKMKKKADETDAATPAPSPAA